ncbi:uncharacterized protein [Arachis hypogaea]|uniref:uncharacterized protein n=1 Tax=Arachis hypogaea TaxID=3818 RepID=UPI003B210602
MKGGECSRGRESSKPLLEGPSYGSPLSHKVSELYVSSSSGLLGSGSGGTKALSRGHAVSITEVKDFLYEEDMELMHMRVCSSLQIGVPMFVPQHLESKDGQPMFGFTVFLSHNPRGMELVAHGLASTEERIARQEVSFTMLEKLLANTGYRIYDYNYRKLVLMQEQHGQQMSDNNCLSQRIRQLEEENAELRSQVQLIEDMLDGY